MLYLFSDAYRHNNILQYPETGFKFESRALHYPKRKKKTKTQMNDTIRLKIIDSGLPTYVGRVTIKIQFS